MIAGDLAALTEELEQDQALIAIATSNALPLPVRSGAPRSKNAG